jgi:hypothetical protein
MVVRVDGIGVQVDPLLINGSLEPFLESNAVFYRMANIPVIGTIERILNHVYLVGPSWIRQVQCMILHQLIEHVVHQVLAEDILLP